MDVPGVPYFVRKLNVRQQTRERGVNVLLTGPFLLPISHVLQVAVQLCVRHNLVPMRRLRVRHRTACRIHLLVWPECPSDVILLQQACKLRDPLIGVLARFAQPDGHVVPVAEVDVRLY